MRIGYAYSLAGFCVLCVLIFPFAVVARVGDGASFVGMWLCDVFDDHFSKYERAR